MSGTVEEVDCEDGDITYRVNSSEGFVEFETREEDTKLSRQAAEVVIEVVSVVTSPASWPFEKAVDFAVVYLSGQVEDLLTRVRSTAGRYTIQRLENMYGKGIVRGTQQEVKLEIEYRKLEDLTGSYLAINGLQISPGEIESYYAGRGGGRVTADITLTFTDGEGQGIVLQHSTTVENMESGDSVLYEVKSLSREQELIKNGSVLASVRFRDQFILQAPFGVDGLGLATINLKTVDRELTPPAPDVSVDEQKSRIDLDFHASSGVETFEIYRSDDPDFSTDVMDPIATIEGKEYSDRQVDGGRKYYYKVIGITGEGRETPISDVVSGTPRADYRFENVDRDEELTTHELAEFNARVVRVGDNQPVEDAPVTLHIDEADWTSEKLTTNADGEFSAEYWAPVNDGSYDLTVETRINQDAFSRDYTLSVSRRPEVGRNLAVETVDLADSVVVAGEELSVDVQVRNYGEEAEEPELHFRFFDRDAENVGSKSEQLGMLEPNDSSTVTTEIEAPADMAGENVALHVQVQNNDELDEQPANALKVHDVHVVADPFNEPIFRTEEYSVPYEETISIDGASVSLTSFSDDTVTFEVDGESTGSLPIDPDGNKFWRHPDNNLILFPIEFSESDSVSTIFAGGTVSEDRIHPQRSVTYRGDVGSYTISGDDGAYIEDEVDFLPAADGGALQSWNDSQSNERLDDHIIEVNLAVPPSQTIEEYVGWMRWEEDDRRYIGGVSMRVAPIHQLSLDVDKLVNNEDIPTNIPGMLLNPKREASESGDYANPVVLNGGDYAEPLPVSLTVEKDGDIVYSDSEELVIENEKSFSFDWPTVGLNTGEYQVRVMVPHGSDQAPDDNVFESMVEFTEPQPLDVSIAEPPTVYEVGDSVLVESEVKQKGEVVADASVVASVSAPDGDQFDLSLDYNEETGIYSSFFYANTGGNYNIRVSADRRLTKSGKAEGQAQTYVDVSLASATESTKLYRPVALNIETSNVGNLQGIAADFVYEANKFDLYDAEGASLLSESGEVSVEQQYSDNGGEIVYGLSRADEEYDEGVYTAQTRAVASFAFIGTRPGEAVFELDSVDLIDSNGDPIATRLNESARHVEVQQQMAAMLLSGGRKDHSMHEQDTMQVSMVNAYGLMGASGKLSYDPARVEIVDIFEGDAFGNPDKNETLFVESIDQEQGEAEFATTQRGEVSSLRGAGNVAYVIYEPISSGTADIDLEKTSLISGYEEREFPHVSSGGGFTISESNTRLLLTAPDGLDSSDDEVTLAVKVENVENLFSFAGDITYDPEQLELTDIEEGDFLNEGGDVNTSFTTKKDSEFGELVVGISRLGTEDQGRSSTEPRTLFEMTFNRLTDDSLNVDLLNTGLLRPDGETEIPHVVENLFDEDEPEQPARIGLDIQRTFGDASGPQDYRLVALPGAIDRPLSEVIDGDPETDWQAFWDDGTEDDYLQSYDGSETFRFRPGRGFWLTSTGTWTVEDSVETMTLDSAQTATISLQEGWNIVSNPLDRDVPWSAVKQASGKELQPVWTFDGSFSQSDTFRTAATGYAYYFYNEESGPDSLTIPYPETSKADQSTSGQAASKHDASGLSDPDAFGKEEIPSLTLVASVGGRPASRISVGLAKSEDQEEATIAPPGRFESASLRIQNPNARSSRAKRLMAATLPPAKGDEGQTFQLRLTSRTDGPAILSAEDLRALEGTEVRLVVPSANETHDLQQKEAVVLEPGSEPMGLKLAVGTEEYVEKKTSELAPQELTLTTYPNPVRRQGTLEYTLPEAGEVILKVYDVLGREVATLQKGWKEAGRYSARLETGGLSSGVYFGRLEAGDQTRTQKITVVQ